MSRYSWVTDSFSHVGAIPTMPQDLYLTIPAGSTVKRFQIRQTYVSMHSENPDNSHVLSPRVSYNVVYSLIFGTPRVIYHANRRIPYEWSVFLAAAIPIYDYQASAADLELGVDQGCSYGKLTDEEAFMHLQTAIYAYPALPSDYLGEWDLEFAALVFH